MTKLRSGPYKQLRTLSLRGFYFELLQLCDEGTGRLQITATRPMDAGDLQYECNVRRKDTVVKHLGVFEQLRLIYRDEGGFWVVRNAAKLFRHPSEKTPNSVPTPTLGPPLSLQSESLEAPLFSGSLQTQELQRPHDVSEAEAEACAPWRPRLRPRGRAHEGALDADLRTRENVVVEMWQSHKARRLSPAEIDALCAIVEKHGRVAITATQAAVEAGAKSIKYIRKVCQAILADVSRNPMCLPRGHVGHGRKPGDHWNVNGREYWWPEEDPQVIVDRLVVGGESAPWARAADVSQFISKTDGGTKS